MVVVLLVLVHSSILYHVFEEGFWLCSMEEEG